MKRPSYNRVVDILRERELELSAMRNKFDKLQNKFMQLEDAFRTNLRAQTCLESMLYKFAKAPEKLKINSIDEHHKKNIRAQSARGTQLTKVRIEKTRWKEAFLHQMKITDKQKLEHEHLVETITNESKKILQTCRQSNAKHFRELLKFYENTSIKVRHFKEAHDASEARANMTTNRILELANVLETLEMFRGVKTEVVCIRAAEVLKSLQTATTESYKQGINRLRQVTWSIDENNNNETVKILQAQNSVLRHVVKSLKRRFQDKCCKVPGSHENWNEIHGNNTRPDNSRGLEENVKESPKPVEKNMLHHETRAKQPDENAEKSLKGRKNDEENKIADSRKTSLIPTISGSQFSLANNIPTNIKKAENDSTKSSEYHRPLKLINVDAFESHQNVIPCEKYNFHIRNNRKFWIRHPKSWTTDSTMVIEFVNSEDFEEATMKRTVFYLGDDVNKLFGPKESGVHCGVQTNILKSAEKGIQTATTSRRFSRVNAGVVILNSEKRAMERSLINLERSVTSLKASALRQAREMIERDVKPLGNEFFNCVERLERKC